MGDNDLLFFPTLPPIPLSFSFLSCLERFREAVLFLTSPEFCAVKKLEIWSVLRRRILGLDHDIEEAK